MKTVPQAMELRNLILENFEKALLTGSVDERERLMNLVIVGRGLRLILRLVLRQIPVPRHRSWMRWFYTISWSAPAC